MESRKKNSRNESIKSIEFLILFQQSSFGISNMLIFNLQCSSDVVLGVDFHPMERDCFVTCGKGHLNFWFIENGNIIKKSGVFESRDKPKYYDFFTFFLVGFVLFFLLF
jgi:hypothetical protein